MSIAIDKKLVRERFGRALLSYDSQAIPQRKIVEELVGMLPPECLERAEHRILEIGCGTGILSHRLTALFEGRVADFCFNDINPDVEPILRTKVGSCPTFVAEDAEQMVWPTALSLIASSSCIQWWHQPLDFVSKSAEALEEGGYLLFSTFLPKNLHELTCVTSTTLEYPQHDEYVAALQEHRFGEIASKEMVVRLYFDTMVDLLRHLKQTGTNGIVRGGMWTSNMIAELDYKYRELHGLSEVEPLPLSYVGVLLCAQKKAT